MPATIARTGGATTTVDGTSQTFSDIPIGTSGNLILLALGTRNVTAVTAYSAVTVNGVAADHLVTESEGAPHSLASIWSIPRADLSGAEEIDVVASFADSQLRGACDVYACTEVALTPLDTLNVGNTAYPLNGDISVEEDGITLAATYNGDSGTVDWTNVTEQVDVDVEPGSDNRFSAAIAANGVTTTLAITATSAGASAQVALAAVSFAFEAGGDVTAPVLSNATATETGETTAALAVDTDEGNGTLFWVVTTSATPPSGAQVAAGQDHTGAAAADSGSQAVAGTGTQNANASGLTAATQYWAHFVQDDDADNRSNVDSSDSFTTDAEAVPPTPIAASEGGGGGGNRRRRRYPYPNVIDDGWDWDAEPEKPPDEPETTTEAVPAARRGEGLAPQKAAVRLPEPVMERSRPASEPSAPRQVEPAAGERHVAALEAEIEALQAQVDDLRARVRDDEEEERLLGLLLEDKED